MAYKLRYSDYPGTDTGPPDPERWIGPPGPPGEMGPEGPGKAIIGTTPSVDTFGLLWWDSNSGQLFVQYDDGTSIQWVSANSIDASTLEGSFLPITGGTVNGQTMFSTIGPTAIYETVGLVCDVFNDGSGSAMGGAGYGVRTNYETYATGVAGSFDVLRGDIMTVAATSVAAGSQWLTNWSILASPTDTAHAWGAFIAEWNMVNRGPDTGWSPTRGGLPQWTGGFQMVPGVVAPKGGGNVGRSVLFGYGVMHIGIANTTTGFIPQTYNGLFIEQNAIAPNGMGVCVSGYAPLTGIPTSPLPYAPFWVGSAWQNGLDMSNATFTGSAIRTPGFAVANNGNVTVGTSTTSGATVFINSAATTQPAVGFYIAGNQRWKLGLDAAGESTGNAGGNIAFYSYNDAGGFLGQPIAIVRATGAIWISNSVGLWGSTPPGAKPTVAGSKGGNVALASLLTALASYGLVLDSST